MIIASPPRQPPLLGASCRAFVRVQYLRSHCFAIGFLDNRSYSFDRAVSVQTDALRPWAVDVDQLRLHTPSHHGGARQAGDLSPCYSRCYRRPSCALRTQRCNCPIRTLSNVHWFGRLVTRRSPEHFVKGECRGFRSVHKIRRHNCSIWYLIKDGL